MSFEAIQQQEQEYIMPTYGRFPVALVSGHGATAVDCNGNEYIDFGSGIGVNCLGYSDPKWVQAVTEQAARLQHVSNLYYNPVQTELAEKLCKMSGYKKVFFANSGAEANECAIKLARKYSLDRYGEDRSDIVTLQNSFHGRTVTTLSATGQKVFHEHFMPFTEGFDFAEANSIKSIASCITDHTCAVMVEFIQGEGGVMPLDPEFVTALHQLCRTRGLLFIADEVQTGVGRTGTLYCWEQYGVRPDILTSAKGLGGGLPIGACLCTESLAEVMGGGMHGSTFGGNPVVCAGALAVLDRMAEPGFLDAVKEKGAYLTQQLKKIEGISGVRGKGMMLGAELSDERSAKEVAAACVENGLLVLTAKTVLRFLPPLTITKEEIDRGLAILAGVLKQS